MDDPENFEVIEAYNRLSLLLEQQQTNFSFEKEIIISPQNNNQRELHNIMENKIDMLAHLISSETKEGIKADNNSLSPTKFQGIKHVSSHNSFVIDNQNSNKNVNNIKNNHDKSNNIYDSVDYSEKTENFDKNYSSKTIIPHMEELINVLVKNKIAKDPINNSSNTENVKFFSSMKSSEKPKKSEKRNNVVYTMKKTKFDAFAIFKKATKKEINQTLERFFQMDQHKKEKLELLKKELTENELKHLKNPEINPDSHILAGQRSKPLHLRTKEILSARKEKEMQTKDKIHMEKEMKDPPPNYKPNLELTKKNCFSSARKNRNRSEFLKDIDIWYKRKNEKIQTSQMNRIKEDCQKMTFHPEINKKSKKSKNKEEFKNTEERLIEAGKNYKEKEKKLIMEFTPTFIPKINKKSQKIVNKIQDIESTPNKTLNDVYSLERRRRSSYLENTISFSNKGREKFSKTIDEIDLMSKEKKHDKSLGANKKNEKINLVQYNETNKFVVEALATKKHGKIMLKIN